MNVYLKKCYANIGSLKMLRPIVAIEFMQILTHGLFFHILIICYQCMEQQLKVY